MSEQLTITSNTHLGIKKMNIEHFRNFCLSLNGVTEGFPFDDVTLVFKVGGKVFALTNVDLFQSLNLKCDPTYAEELREQFPDFVKPGYHMNKKHWNTLSTELDDDLILELTKHSYNLVFNALPKKVRQELGE